MLLSFKRDIYCSIVENTAEHFISFAVAWSAVWLVFEKFCVIKLLFFSGGSGNVNLKTWKFVISKLCNPYLV